MSGQQRALFTLSTKNMKVLVACEESQAVTKEFRALGHEAYSCDIIECSGGHPEWHIMQDVIPLLNGNCTFTTCDKEEHVIDGKWDMIIAFPPCTHLAVSGAAWFEKKRKDGRQEEAIEFFMKILNADCEKIAVENPVNIISGDYIGKHFPLLQQKYGFKEKYNMAIKTYCNWGLYNEDNCDCLEAGDNCDRFSYWDDGKRVTLEDVTIQDIRKNEVTLELEDYEEITISIEDVIDWE